MRFDKKAYQKVWREKNKEKIKLEKKLWASTPEAKKLNLARSKRYQSKANGKVVTTKATKKYKDSNRGRFVVAKLMAKRKKKEWMIVEEDYTKIVNQSCYYCELPISSRGIGLDRINNNIGYVVTNVLPCCHNCNRTRGDRFTIAEMKAIMNFIKEFRLNNG